MAKKTGYIGKAASKIIAVATTGGIILLTTLGFNIYSRTKDYRPSNTTRPNDTYSDWTDLKDTTIGMDVTTPNPHPIVTEPSITTVPSTTPVETTPVSTTPANTTVVPPVSDTTVADTAVADTTVPAPSIKDDVNTGADIELYDNFIDVLAKLTSMSKDYIQSVTKSATQPDLTISGFNVRSIDTNSGDILMVGTLSTGSKISNFVASINNPDTSLDIYNLSSSSITETNLIDALNDLLSSSETELKIQLKQHFAISNEDDVIVSILESRLDDLETSNSSDAKVQQEIHYLNNLLSNVSDLELSVLLNTRETTNNGYKYSFTTTINTGDFLYYSEHSFETQHQLTSNALRANIENYLANNLSNSTTYRNSNTEINKILYQIQDRVEELDSDYSFNK